MKKVWRGSVIALIVITSSLVAQGGHYQGMKKSWFLQLAMNRFLICYLLYLTFAKCLQIFGNVLCMHRTSSYLYISSKTA